jgi:hypothetical protein
MTPAEAHPFQVKAALSLARKGIKVARGQTNTLLLARASHYTGVAYKKTQLALAHQHMVLYCEQMIDEKQKGLTS